MFFAKPGEYEACELYSLGHLLLFIITVIAIIIAVEITKTQDKNKIRKIIRTVTVIAWVLEIIKIIFNISIGNAKNPNTYLPCYYCSLLLYAGILSSLGKGKVQRMGDVFLETGGIIAGIVFLIFPTTSLPEYPPLHFLSLHSFFFHGMMIYIGIIMNLGKYAVLSKKDIKYYASLIIGISIIAYVLNITLNTNFMFISKDLPRTPLTCIYKWLGKFYTAFMVLVQIIPLFYVALGFIRLFKYRKIK